MSTEPDPKVVHALAQQVADRALHNNVHLDQWITDALVARFGEGDLETRVAYHPAVARRLAVVKAAWPDEQPQDGPLTPTELAELTASIEHLSGPDAWNEDRLEAALIPVTHYVPRLLAMAVHEPPQDERDGDVRAVARLLASADDSIAEMFAAHEALEARFADRIDELIARDARIEAEQ